MDLSNSQSSQSTCPNAQQSSTKPSVEFQYIDVLEFQNTSNPLATSMLDTSSTPSQQEKEYENKSYDIQAEEYHALFSASVKANKRNKIFYSHDDISLSPSTGKTPKSEKETVDELSLILVECMDRINTRGKQVLLRKLYAEVEKEERLERFIVERLRKSKVKAISELYEKIPTSVEDRGVDDKSGDGVSTRGLCDNVDDTSYKLDRFKVKTFDAGVNVSEEKKK